MITTREFLRLGVLLSAGGSGPVNSNRVLTYLDIDIPSRLMAPVGYLESARLLVSALDQYGVAMVHKESFSISSDNPAVATVGNAQYSPDMHFADIRAIAPGEAVVSVSLTINGVTRLRRQQ